MSGDKLVTSVIESLFKFFGIHIRILFENFFKNNTANSLINSILAEVIIHIIVKVDHSV